MQPLSRATRPHGRKDNRLDSVRTAGCSPASDSSEASRVRSRPLPVPERASWEEGGPLCPPFRSRGTATLRPSTRPSTVGSGSLCRSEAQILHAKTSKHKKTAAGDSAPRLAGGLVALYVLRQRLGQGMEHPAPRTRIGLEQREAEPHMRRIETGERHHTEPL